MIQYEAESNKHTLKESNQMELFSLDKKAQKTKHDITREEVQGAIEARKRGIGGAQFLQAVAAIASKIAGVEVPVRPPNIANYLVHTKTKNHCLAMIKAWCDITPEGKYRPKDGVDIQKVSEYFQVLNASGGSKSAASAAKTKMLELLLADGDLPSVKDPIEKSSVSDLLPEVPEQAEAPELDESN